MLNCTDHSKDFTLKELSVIYDSHEADSLNVKKEVVGMDEYIYKIYECKIKEDKLLLKITENGGIRYLKVYDL